MGLPSRCCGQAGTNTAQSGAQSYQVGGSGFAAQAGPDWSKNPWNTRPPGWLPFDCYGSVSVAPGDTTVVCSAQLRAEEFARVEKMAHGLDNVAGWGELKWTVKIDGVPIPEYKDIQDQLGETGPMTEIGVRVARELATVSLEVESPSTAGATYLCFGRLYGYKFKSSLAVGF